MCYHYAIKSETNEFKLQIANAAEQLTLQLNLQSPVFHANGFAHPAMPVVTMEQPGRVQQFRWGLIPSFIKSKTEANKISTMTLNATCEGVFDKPSFKGSIMKKRCLIPATGFFEWHTINKTKYPFFIRRKDHKLFVFGGIHAAWMNREDETITHSFAIITTPGNAVLNDIHNQKKRMPLILEPGNELAWLNPALNNEAIDELMKPLNEKYLEAFPISKLITTKGANANVAEVIDKMEYEDLGELNTKWAG
jgi:putative SOS response-associated peptidase YedK